MSVATFLGLLFTFSLVSSLITEAIKKIVTDKKNISYNIVALITALIVGGCGMGIYYQLSSVPFTANNIIYLVLMGLASGLCATVGYDKVKQTIEQMFNKKPIE